MSDWRHFIRRVTEFTNKETPRNAHVSFSLKQGSLNLFVVVKGVDWMIDKDLNRNNLGFLNKFRVIVL